MSIENNASKILTFLYPKGTKTYCGGDEIAKGTNLEPDEINDAIEILESNGFVSVDRLGNKENMDTSPIS